MSSAKLAEKKLRSLSRLLEESGAESLVIVSGGISYM